VARLEDIAQTVYGDDSRKTIKSFDIIGDIAIIKIPDELVDDRRFIFAREIINSFPYIKVVYRQVEGVEGLFRLRRLEHLAGEERSTTIYREHGSRFWVDVERVYFSPRLSYERRRISTLVSKGERVLNMFAGVGTFTIHIAKKGAKVYSIDINPYAISLHLINNRLNRVEDKISTVLGDSSKASEYVEDVDRVLMPLPELAIKYIPYALPLLKDGGWMHVYLHTRYLDDEEEALRTSEDLVSRNITDLGWRILTVRSRVVREVAVRTAQVVVDVEVSR